MADSSQPFYYHINSNRNNDLGDLSIRVILRRIYDANKSNKDEESYLQNYRNHQLTCKNMKKKKSHIETQKHIHWQEKIIGPREALISFLRSKGQNDKRDQNFFTIDNQTSERDRCVNDLCESLKEALIFTYVDREDTLPIKDEQINSNNSTWLSCLMNIRQNIKKSNIIIRRERMERESTYKTMRIMTALECDVKRLRRKMKGKNKHFRENDVCWYEHTLCEIKVHDSGLMEAIPGFSENDFEGHNTSICHNTKNEFDATEMNNVRFTKFRFMTPSGSVYEYSLERIFENLDNKISVEKKRHYLFLEYERHRQHRLRNRKLLLLACNHVPKHPLLHVAVDFVSAINFDSIASQNLLFRSGLLCLEHEVLLPSGWCYESEYLLDEKDSSPLQGSSYWISSSCSRKLTNFQTFLFGDRIGIQIEPGLALILVGVIGSLLPLTHFFHLTLPFAVMNAIFLFCLITTNTYNAPFRPAEFKINHSIRICLRPSQANLRLEWNKTPAIAFQIWSKRRGFYPSSVEGCALFQLPISKSIRDQVISIQTWKPLCKDMKIEGEIRGRMRDYYFGTGSQMQFLRNLYYKGTSSKQSNHISRINQLSETSGSVKVVINVINNNNEYLSGKTAEAQKKSVGDKAHCSSNHLYHKNETIDEVLMRLRRHRRKRRIRDILNGAEEPMESLENFLETSSLNDESLHRNDDEMVYHIKNPRTANVLSRVISRKYDN